MIGSPVCHEGQDWTWKGCSTTSWCRGWRRRAIFLSDKDREDLVNRLTEIAPKTRAVI